ncbi:MAG: PEP-CTERM sorting domain-containing protein [Pirellulales bacterium]
MRKPLFCVIALAVLQAAATSVLAQGVVTNVVTPPLQTSDVITLPIDIHNGQPNPPWAGWAGGRMKMHLMPTGEIDVLSLTPVAAGPGTRGTAPPFPGTPTGPTIISPFGPASNNVASQPLFFTAVHPNAQNSGIPITPSVNQPLFDLALHVKNSNPSGNGNVDATFMFWNIWHLHGPAGGTGSTLLQLVPSDYIWVRSSIESIDQLHIFEGPLQSQYVFPTNPAPIEDPNAHWLHIPRTVTFHLTGGLGSQFYATFLNTATLGIEHVPEPTTAVLLVAGIGSAVTGAWLRRRRRKPVS